MSKSKLISPLIMLVLFFCAQSIYSQVTTASINGTVVDQNNTALPGANVIAVHIPSGTQYGTNTRTDGKYNILGL